MVEIGTSESKRPQQPVELGRFTDIEENRCAARKRIQKNVENLRKIDILNVLRVCGVTNFPLQQQRYL
ncbi:hypothetical protein GE061_010614 [Apolygus lucorum]|uniref:Uncharacterized protein n=1 Tax=Apolygus lucorum TaxID=248454 RepID=A0A8S9XWC8_APOLU|nr:hypothetical protein GE061_010614 [Apolygus lucorum]